MAGMSCDLEALSVAIPADPRGDEIFDFLQFFFGQ